MAYYIEAFKTAEVAEFEIVAAYMKKGYRPKHKGYGPFTYEQQNYAFRCTYETKSTVHIFQEKQPDYVAPTPETPPSTPARPGPRGRRPSYGSNRSDTIVTHYFNHVQLDTSSGNLTKESRAQVVNSNHGVKRVIYLDDLKTELALQTRITKLAGSSLASSRMKTLFSRNVVELWGFIVEGVDFKIEADSSKLPCKVLRHRNQTIIQAFEKYFIVVPHSPTTLILDWIQTRPIDSTQFLLNMKKHFLANMQVSLEKKERELLSLQQRLWDSTKEIAEIKFVFGSVESSSNAHFAGLIEKISAIPAFERIDFIGAGFIVTTKDLWAEIDDTRVYIGVFEIRLSITDKFVVEYRNTASPSTSSWERHHPHGNCTGGHYGVIQQSLATLDYYTFILSVVELLQTVNPREKTLEGLISGGWTEKKPAKKDLKCLEEWQNLLTAKSNIDRPERAGDNDTDTEEEDDDIEEDEDDD